MKKLPVKHLGLRDYAEIFNAMLEHIHHKRRCELWILEHLPVYTQGKRSLPEHFHESNNIPIIPTDRGGQVTYHGPGQMIIYPLLQLSKWELSPIHVVNLLEETTVNTLKQLGINSEVNPEARGVYIHGKKVGSIGLKMKAGYIYHGMAINISMDLTPFKAIVPCGDSKIQMTNIACHTAAFDLFKDIWLDIFLAKLVTKSYN